MGYKNIKVTNETDDLLDICIKDFINHYPEFKNIKISRNKIISEVAEHYLRSP